MSKRDIIFGVYMKADKHYFGFFKKEEDAVKELKIQGGQFYPKEKYDPDLKQIVDKDGKKLITIHGIVLR